MFRQMEGRCSYDGKTMFWETNVGAKPRTKLYHSLVAQMYTKTDSACACTPPKRRIKPQRVRVKDVTLRQSDQSIIPNTAPLQELLLATHTTLTITNQKNGYRGQCIHHHCTGLTASPIKALAQHVAHIMAHTQDQNT